MARRPLTNPRKQASQQRSRATVDALVEATARILVREGFDKASTNRIAAAAGVSIGSLYQYFPDKRAIFIALHERHIEQIDRLVESTLVQHAAAPLDELMRAMVEAMVDAHTGDPKLFEMMQAEVPHRAEGTRDFGERLHGAFLLAISARKHEIKGRRDWNTVAFVVTQMVEALSHGAALKRPAGISLAEAKAEAVRAVLAYLRA